MKELRSCESSLLSVTDAQVFLLRFVLPFAVCIQRTNRQQNMGMRIVIVCRMDSCICAHAVCNKLLPNKISQQVNLLFSIQLNRQSNHKFSRQTAVLAFLCFFNGIPENAAVVPFSGCAFRQKYLLPGQPSFPCIVMMDTIIFIGDAGATHVGCRRHSGSSLASADDFCLQMKNCYGVFLLCLDFRDSLIDRFYPVRFLHKQLRLLVDLVWLSQQTTQYRLKRHTSRLPIQSAALHRE